jgi:hypothetical protein
MTTSIDDALFSSFENISINIDLSSKNDIDLLQLFESDITEAERVNIIVELYNRDKNLVIECINNVLNSIFMNKSSVKKRIILWVIRNKYFNFPLRIRCIETIEQLDGKTDEQYLNCLEDVMNEQLEFKKKYEVGTTFFWNVFKNVLRRNIYPSEYLLNRLCNIWKSVILDASLQEEFRYKLLQSLCNNEEYKDNLKYSFSNISLEYSWEDYRYIMYIIQFIIKTNNLNSTHLDVLYNIINERKLQSNAKADIADFFLGLKENFSVYTLPENIDEYISKGKEILDKLSYEEGGAKTFYNNTQNIHKIEIDSSINPFIEMLLSINLEIPTNEDELDDFIDKVVDEIKDYSSNIYSAEEQIRIIGSINRFILDNTLYSKYSVSLLTLLVRSYYYIQNHQYKDELMKRLCEELCDMADTCTTGHIGRLVNIFSGYEITLSMPIEEEIKSCVYARLTNIIGDKPEEIRDLIFESIGTSEEIKEKDKTHIDMSASLVGTKNAYLDEHGKIIEFILSENDIIKEQLMHKTEDPEVLFYKLLGKDISALLDDLRNEYKSLIEDGKLSEQDLDLYFRKSVNLFQVGEGI